MPQINSDIINISLEYIWIPVVLPLIIIFLKSVLRVKELKKGTDPEIEEFINLYNLRIKENLRICAEEILQFIERREGEVVEHHLYVCKKLSKTVGFIKFMYSEQHKYVFIAYTAIDKEDSVARQYAFNLMLRKIYKKYLKTKKATMILTEIERGTKGNYKTGLAKLISRYAKKFKKQSYIIKFDYLQPSMPDDEYGDVSEEILSLVYIPMYTMANMKMPKNELLSILQTIYFEIYYPSCNEITACDCNDYNSYLESIMDIYKSDLPEYIDLIPI